jgi:hypothetical protein
MVEVSEDAGDNDMGLRGREAGGWRRLSAVLGAISIPVMVENMLMV